jgi:hypothetical protein
VKDSDLRGSPPKDAVPRPSSLGSSIIKDALNVESFLGNIPIVTIISYKFSLTRTRVQLLTLIYNLSSEIQITELV